jgi:hypothetical protein
MYTIFIYNFLIIIFNKHSIFPIQHLLKREYLYKKQYLLNTQICFAAMILIEIDTIGDGLV